RCPDCELATPRQRPSAPFLREDRCWQRMAARPARATRRAAPAPSGPPAGRGSDGRHVRALTGLDMLICRNEGVACAYIYEPASIFTHGSLDLNGDRRAAFPLFRQEIRSLPTLFAWVR